jgi:hypothetical protein
VFNRVKSSKVVVQRGYVRAVLQGKCGDDGVGYQVTGGVRFKTQTLDELQVAFSRTDSEMPGLASDGFDEGKRVGQTESSASAPSIKVDVLVKSLGQRPVGL